MHQLVASPPLLSRGEPLKKEMGKAYASCLAVLAVAIVFFALNTAQGIGIFTDSTRYMGISARPYDAPLYHWALTLGWRLGLDFTSAATVIAVITLTANTILIYALLARAHVGWQLATIGTCLVVLAPQFVTLQSSAMSEPPFLTFLLLTVWAGLDYFETGSRRALIACSILLGLATLTRFAAPPLGVAIACLILLSPRSDRPRKLADIGLLTAVGGAIFLGWMAYSQLTAGRSIGRDLWFYGNMGLREWVSSLEVMTAWILPDQIPLMIRIPILVGVLGIALAHCFQSLAVLKRGGQAESEIPAIVLPAILGLFFVFYMAFIVLSVSIEANLTLTGRYAFPAYVALAMLIALRSSDYQSKNPGATYGHAIVIGLVVLTCGLHAARSAARTPDVYRDGYGYQHVSWRTSPTLDVVRTLPRNAVLYSNGPDIISFHTGRTADFSPHEYMLRTGQPEPGNPISRQFANLTSIANDYPAYVVIFDRVDWRHYLTDETKLVAQLNLQRVEFSDDGRVYRIPPARSGLTDEGARNGDE